MITPAFVRKVRKASEGLAELEYLILRAASQGCYSTILRHRYLTDKEVITLEKVGFKIYGVAGLDTISWDDSLKGKK